jgi:bifunctional non-homologous end joining protein LigD
LISACADLVEGIIGIPSADMPGFIAPQLATLRTKAPVGEKWVHEIKYDGYRVQIHLNRGRVTIFTRNGHDWTNRLPVIAESFDIPVERAIFDGEVVVIHEGRTNFSELQADLAAGKQRRLVYYAFDLLFLDGFDLRKSPQIERKRILKMLFDETKLKSPILYSEHTHYFLHRFDRANRGLLTEATATETAGASPATGTKRRSAWHLQPLAGERR